MWIDSRLATLRNLTVSTKLFNSEKEKVSGQKLRMGDVLLIYFEQIVRFCVIIYSNANSLQLFWEDCSLNFTDKNFSSWFLKILPQPKNILPSVSWNFCDKFQVYSLYTKTLQDLRMPPIITIFCKVTIEIWVTKFRVSEFLSTANFVSFAFVLRDGIK